MNDDGWKTRRRYVVLVVLVLATTACSDNDGSSGASRPTLTMPARTLEAAEAVTAFAGEWTGDWRHTSGGEEAGTLRIELQRVSRVLRGTIELSGSQCLAGSEVTAVVNGETIQFEAAADTDRVLFTGDLSGNTIDGTFGMSCGQAEGVWQARRNG